jgi:hypothetical protein
VSYITKLMLFVLLSAAYWFALLMLLGLLMYVSICHYPDYPGCKTDLTLVGVVLLIAAALYWLAILGFRRWTKNDPRGGYR